MVSLFLSISDAIDYAHQRGLLHIDIKPANILLEARHAERNPMGEPMLTDFGIVKMLGTEAGTLTISTVGTPVYISPEQARGNPVSSASDIYSLGVILYEMSTGEPPFKGDLLLAILQQHVSAPPPPPESINSAISPDLSEVVLRGLAKDPTDRFPNAIALTTALAEALNVPLPERQRQPISSPDIRSLQDAVDGRQDINALNNTVILNGELPLMPPAIPPTFIYTPSTRVSAILTKVPESSTKSIPVSASGVLPSPSPVRQRYSRGILIAFIALLITVFISSGLLALVVSRAGSSSTNIVGHAFFANSGAAQGANNMGINDIFQVNMSNISLSQAGMNYYAWLLPDQNQNEASPRALGALDVTNGMASLLSPYVDPQHHNLLVSFSRFLVTEEPASPVPLNPSLDKGTWRYFAEIPQNPSVKVCIGAMNQLNDLCHLRHLLSGDPELARVKLPGGLNYWLLNNVKEMQQLAAKIVDQDDPVSIRQNVVDILYLLDGKGCVSSDLLQFAPGREYIPDDGNLSKVAAIPLLDCSLLPNDTGYLVHIHNHLNAMVQSPGVLDEQLTLANSISIQLNTINAWLRQMQQDARKLIALDDQHLMLADGRSIRSEMDMLAMKVLHGSNIPNTSNTEKGVVSLSDQIQQLATMDITRY